MGDHQRILTVVCFFLRTKFERDPLFETFKSMPQTVKMDRAVESESEREGVDVASKGKGRDFK